MAEVTNWFGNLVSHPKVIVDANTVDDIIAVLKDGSRYPAPVRAVGSNHSTTPCGVAEGGTLIRMKMNRILEIGADAIRVEAGARLIDMARELEKRNLQFYVNTEIGSLTAGSAACAGTEGRVLRRRIRHGRIVRDRNQNSASERRAPGGDRVPSGPDAESAVELRHVWRRLRGDLPDPSAAANESLFMRPSRLRTFSRSSIR